MIGLSTLPPRLIQKLVLTEANLRQVSYRAITSALLYLLKPDHVVCPLVAEDIDAAQLIARLQMTGYGGRLTVLATVPDPAMIEAELQALAPDIPVRVVAM